jgi:hypothetical protein
LNNPNAEYLYNLLPVIYRQLDIEQGEPLRALMDVIESEYCVLEADIGGLYDNWFIETCDDWVVPYIADLLGVRGTAVEKDLTSTLRSRVANTIAYRRRKGVVTILERAAQDVTGWKAHVVEFFKLLSMTQFLRNVNLERGRTANVCNRKAMNETITPFNYLAQTIDVRSLPIDPMEQLRSGDPLESASLQGKYNLGNMGLFLWRLQSYPITHGTPKQIQPLCYSFHPLGDEWQPPGLELFTLFNQPLTETSIQQPSDERNVPTALRRSTLAAELEARRQGVTPQTSYFGSQPVLQVFTKTNSSPPLFESIPPENMVVRNLRYCRGSLLFSMEGEFGNLLDSGGKLHYEIRNQFKSHRVWLTQDANVIVQERRSQWLVIEGFVDQHGDKRERAYVLTRVGDKIEVYDQSLFVLFGMPLTDTSYLEQGQIQNEIRRQFIEQGISLSANAQVTIKQPLRRWLITDNAPDEQQYLIIRDDRQLEVYDPSIKVAIDPALGRLAFPFYRAPDDVRVSYSYGFSADIGGGPYDRRKTLATVESNTWRALVSIDNPATPPDPNIPRYGSLSDALQDWASSDQNGLIQIGDNGIYDLGTTDQSGAVTGFETVEVPNGQWLVIEAANGVAPCLKGGLHLMGSSPSAVVKLNGLLMEGVILLDGTLNLDILHCTLKPRVPGLLPGINLPLTTERLNEPGLNITIRDSIIGRICLPGHARGLLIEDSIVDGGKGAAIAGISHEDQGCVITALDIPGEFGPPTTLSRSTIFGQVSVKELAASDVIFTDQVEAHNRQSGSLRYSYLPPGSKTPQRYRCQPDLALHGIKNLTERKSIARRMRPSFTSEVYGHPGYAQLGLQCPREIQIGAEDGSEMGIFNQLYQPQRRAELRLALAEYLPFGQEAGIFYAN